MKNFLVVEMYHQSLWKKLVEEQLKYLLWLVSDWPKLKKTVKEE